MDCCASEGRRDADEGSTVLEVSPEMFKTHSRGNEGSRSRTCETVTSKSGEKSGSENTEDSFMKTWNSESRALENSGSDTILGDSDGSEHGSEHNECRSSRSDSISVGSKDVETRQDETDEGGMTLDERDELRGVEVAAG